MKEFSLPGSTASATDYQFWLSDEEDTLETADSNQINPQEEVTLLDLLDSVLTKGVIVSGDLTLSVAGVDLLYIGLRLMVCTAQKAVEVGAVKMKNGRIV